MKLSPPAWLADTRIRALIVTVHARGGTIRVVGGVVRDLVRGEAAEGFPADIDMCTSLLPEPMLEVAQHVGLKAIPTGLAHGTITVLLPESRVEITTLRRDIATDGRHAEVAFSDDFADDAARRDFTMNALSMDIHGEVFDYHGGVEDARAGLVKFIGDPAARITEDALRMLRFFRFVARYGQGAPDTAALQAIATHTAMVERLSGERIQHECMRLLATSAPRTALTAMSQTGLAPLVFFAPLHLAALEELLTLESLYHTAPHAWLRLHVLLFDIPDALPKLAARWKLSNHAKQLLSSLAAAEQLTPESDEGAHKKIIRAHGRHYYKLVLFASAVRYHLSARGKRWDLWPHLHAAEAWEPPEFPVKAADLMSYGVPQGRLLGEKLRELEQEWEAQDYGLSKQDLLKKIEKLPGR